LSVSNNPPSGSTCPAWIKGYSHKKTFGLTKRYIYIYIYKTPKTLPKTKFARRREVAPETSRSGYAASERRVGAARYVGLTPSSLKGQHHAWRGRPAYALKPLSIWALSAPV